MNDPEAMCFFKDVTNLRSDVDRLRSRKAPFTRESLRKSFTFDKLHHDEVTAVRQVAGVEDHRCVPMTQLGHRSRFAEKTIVDVGIGRALALDDLYCDGAFELEVRGKIDCAHPAGPDFAFYSEPASDKLGDIHMDLPSGKRPGATSVFLLGWGKRRRSLAPPVLLSHDFSRR